MQNYCTLVPWRGLGAALSVLLIALGCSQDSGPQGQEVTLPELNRTLQVWVMKNGSYPQELWQLTNFPALHGKRLPAPPPGKKLAIDPRTRTIIFADQ